jgi:hypothetical protein
VGKRKVLVGGGGVGSQEGHRFNKSDCRAQKVEYKSKGRERTHSGLDNYRRDKSDFSGLCHSIFIYYYYYLFAVVIVFHYDFLI